MMGEWRGSRRAGVERWEGMRTMDEVGEMRMGS